MREVLVPGVETHEDSASLFFILLVLVVTIKSGFVNYSS